MGLVLLAVLAAGGYELWYLNSVYNKVTKLHGTDKKASKHLAPQIPTSSQPITALLIGSDHRGDGATGKNGLSDTLMLARLDPGHHMVSLLSIPRDLWVATRAAAARRSTPFYSEGGDNASLQAVEQVTGVKPNYLLNVDFAGFRRLVDTLGGIYVNVDQYYYNPPAQEQYTGFSPIDIKPGYQKLNGARRARLLALPPHRRRLPPPGPPADVPARVRGPGLGALPRHLGDSTSRSSTTCSERSRAASRSSAPAAMRRALRRCSPSQRPPTRPARASSASAPTAASFTAPDGSDAEQVTNFPQAIYQWKHPWKLGNAAAGLPTGKVKHAPKPWKPAVTPATVRSRC